jgi:hypothetical protein
MKVLFPRQIQRISYLFRMLAWMGICLLFGLFLGYIGLMHPLILKSPICGALGWIFVIAMYSYLILFVVAPRFLDIGLPNICIILAFIPGCNLILGLMALFAPTDWWLRYKSK